MEHDNIKKEVGEETELSRLWGAIADVGSDEQRHHADVTRRLRILEEGTKGHFSDDPTQALVSIVLLAVVLQVGLPLLIDLLAAWRGKNTQGE
jgi:hypothetical protein